MQVVPRFCDRGSLAELANFIPRSGEQCPRKVVDLLGPGLTGGPKVPWYQRSNEAPGRGRGAEWSQNEGFASFCFVSDSFGKYIRSK